MNSKKVYTNKKLVFTKNVLPIGIILLPLMFDKSSLYLVLCILPFVLVTAFFCFSKNKGIFIYNQMVIINGYLNSVKVPISQISYINYRVRHFYGGKSISTLKSIVLYDETGQRLANIPLDFLLGNLRDFIEDLININPYITIDENVEDLINNPTRFVVRTLKVIFIALVLIIMIMITLFRI